MDRVKELLELADNLAFEKLAELNPNDKRISKLLELNAKEVNETGNAESDQYTNLKREVLTAYGL